MPGMEINFRNTFLEVSPKLCASMPRPQTMPNLIEQLGMSDPTYVEDLEFDTEFDTQDGVGLLDEAHMENDAGVMYGGALYDANSFRDACQTLLSVNTGATIGLNENRDTPPSPPPPIGGLMIEGIGTSLMQPIDSVRHGGTYSPSSRQQYKANRDAHQSNSEALPPEMLTTVMLRNIPNKLSQMDIANAVKHEGFLGEFDFFYSPLDFKSGSNLGYAFINFISHEVAVRFRLKIAGLLLARSVAEANTSGLYWDENSGSKATVITPEVSAQLMRSNKQCGVAWARIQGLEANIKHYRNSPVNELASGYRPMLFASKDLVINHPTIPVGSLLPFPLPDRRASNGGRASLTASTAFKQQHQQHQQQQQSGMVNLNKIFVGGLSPESTSASLEEYFNFRFPMFTVLEAVVIMDRRTRVSKGFGFATFDSNEAVQNILHPLNNPHIIDGHSVVLRSYTSNR
ncbi:dc50, putative [Perkinsus marinus ATCC 50983]|uniref:Dc50, putative n=2 Tax=Perkinsus marinus (strain ATCC 50983 / TXsc) TaxID=423536 RepID=C5M1C0_PERM5|nr:dc50, putative [Perkinsus marinus ATCC 50983]EEQ97242.1 dc50, putative [Perkinsus marinus ATCC 50983]|eukprot:XP_002764525.1 dc50, putative [Perkinsus marinus ATCC 50983]